MTYIKEQRRTAQCKQPNALSKLLAVIYLLLSVQLATAQVYPVQVTPQLIPPYSLKLSDYQSTSAEKLFVNLLLTDTQELGRQVRLKLFIEGQGLNIQSLDFVAGAAPIFLDGGINQRLSNLDLRPYFNLNNLLGISPQQYSRALPDGRYNFCFQVFDFNSNQPISAKRCFPVYLILNDPPILNTPFRGDLVSAQNPQNLIFNWTPRHLNATNVQYEFTIKELWDTGLDPQAAFLASPPLHQETTFATTLLYGPANIQLLEGKTYGWQVRALVSDGISETSVFRNNGYSEIFHFKYVGHCDTPQFILSEALNAESVKISWQFSEHLRYQIQYRKKGYSEADWFSGYAYNQNHSIYNLEPGTTYEFRVGGECTPQGGFAFSAIHEFSTPTEDQTAYYNCGIPPEIEISNQTPLPALNVGETFKASDFPVVVGEVTGSNGNFTGWGYITLPFLEELQTIIDLTNEASEGKINIGKYTRIKVVFSNIGINTDYQLTSGFVETEYDPDWNSIIDLDDLIDDIAGDDGEIETFDATDIDIKDVIVDEDGTVILIDDNNNQIPIDVKLPVVITDQNGDQWTVDEEGNITQGTSAEGGQATNANTNGVSGSGNVNEISSKDVTVKFVPSGYYGTDEYNKNITSSSYKDEYEFIKTHDDKEYSVLYKLISDKPEATDEINAEVTFANGKTKDDIVFKTKQGGKVETKWTGNTATLTLKKQFNFAKDELLATVKLADSTQKYDIAGKLNLWHAQQQQINVTLVPVNGTLPNNIDNQINEIYHKVGINFNITNADRIDIGPEIWDGAGETTGKLDIGDSALLANYTPEERAIFNYYKAQHTVAQEQYYIFILYNIPTSKPQIEGFMPLKRQYGFVFASNDTSRPAYQVAAHELGHGVFGLEHPFSKYDFKEKDDTTLLMDYGSGTDFTHTDWQLIHAPGLQL